MFAIWITTTALALVTIGLPALRAWDKAKGC